MSKPAVNWEGCFVPMVTPFDRDGLIDEPAFRRTIDLLIADGVDGIIIAGSTGEWYVLTDTERARLFHVAAEQARGRVTLLGGTSAIGTAETVALTRAAKEAGMAGVMILPPPYAMPNEREVVRHVAAVSDAVGVPILIYNNPGGTGINLTAKIVERLADGEAVVALKDSTKDLFQMGETIRRTRDRLRIFVGLEPYAVPAVLLGARGIVAMAPNILGSEAAGFYWAIVKGEWERVRVLQGKLSRLYEAFYAPGRAAYTVIKEAMNLVGRPGGFPRPPLLPLEPAERDELRTILRELGAV